MKRFAWIVLLLPALLAGWPAAAQDDGCAAAFDDIQTFTAQRERRRRGGSYWVAYRRRAGVLRRVYLSKSDHLTRDYLEHVALILASCATNR